MTTIVVVAYRDRKHLCCVHTCTGRICVVKEEMELAGQSPDSTIITSHHIGQIDMSFEESKIQCCIFSKSTNLALFLIDPNVFIRKLDG